MTTTTPAPITSGEALKFGASIIELFDDATMRNDYMLDSGECAGILRALADSPYFVTEQVQVPSEREGDKLRAVWGDIAKLVEQHTGKPCGPEPLDDLQALLAQRAGAADKPVAWMVGGEIYKCHDAIPARLLPPLGQPVPLYAAPVAATADKRVASEAEASLRAALNHVRDALRFYAEGHHFERHDINAWDTVSGEPANFFEDEANTATVEDGSLAKQAIEDIALVECYIAATADAAPAGAVADWRVGNLLSVNTYGYPGMGSLFAQVWQGDDLIARVYGNTAEEVRERASRVAAAEVTPAPAAMTASHLTPQDFARLIEQHTGMTARQCPDTYADCLKLCRAVLDADGFAAPAATAGSVPDGRCRQCSGINWHHDEHCAAQTNPADEGGKEKDHG